MILSFLLLGITTFLLFFIPLKYFLLCILYIYSLLVWYEVYRGNLNFLDLGVLSSYSVVAIVYYVLGYENILPFTGSFIYGTLGLACFLGAVFKKPFTAFSKSLDEDEMRFHVVLNVVLGIVFVLALIFSVILFPNPAYIYMPLVFVGVGSFISIWFTKFVVIIWEVFGKLKKEGYLGDRKEGREFLRRFVGNDKGLWVAGNDFIVKEVKSKKEEDIFYNTLRKGYLSVYLKSKKRKEKSYEEFFEEILVEIEKYKSRSLFFICLKVSTGESVGCIRVVFSDKWKYKGNLPLEEFLPISLEEFRRRGYRICEVGRFVITAAPEEKGTVAFMIMGNMLIPLMGLKGIDVYVSDALEGVEELYKKLGFEMLEEKFFDKEMKQNSFLGWISFRNLIKRASCFESGKVLLRLVNVIYKVNDWFGKLIMMRKWWYDYSNISMDLFRELLRRK